MTPKRSQTYCKKSRFTAKKILFLQGFWGGKKSINSKKFMILAFSNTKSVIISCFKASMAKKFFRIFYHVFPLKGVVQAVFAYVTLVRIQADSSTHIQSLCFIPYSGSGKTSIDTLKKVPGQNSDPPPLHHVQCEKSLDFKAWANQLCQPPKN